MEIFLSITFIFIVGSLSGYLLELLFRRIVHKTWINPGFLKGPYLPLYGFGLTILFLIAVIPFESFIKETWLVIVIKILLVGLMMTLIELISGLIFIKGMNIQLWDYSNQKGNFMGIICPLFSFFWALIGAGYVIFLHPLIYDAVIWFTNNIYYSFFVGIVLGFMIYDFISSMNIAAKIKTFAKEHQIVIKYEELKVHLKQKRLELKKKVNFIKPLDGFLALSKEGKLLISTFSKNKNKKDSNK